MDTGTATQPTRSCCRRSKALSVRATSVPTPSFTQTGLPSLSSTLLSLVASACELCYGSLHITLSCLCLPLEQLLIVHAICEEHINRKHNSDGQQRYSTSILCFYNNCSLNSNCQLFLSFRAIPKICSKLAGFSIPQNWDPRYLMQEPSIKTFLTGCTVIQAHARLGEVLEAPLDVKLKWNTIAI